MQTTKSERVVAFDSSAAKSSCTKGVEPGSFLDIIMNATNSLTGKPFTDDEVTCRADAHV
jgi:hypothetical protein